MPKPNNGDSLPPTRQAGVLLHLTSLPGPYGIGELGAQAHAFVDALKRMELGVWQFLPLGPTAFGNSPYQPLSTFAGNELLIDLDELVSLGLLGADDVRRAIASAGAAVDYGKVIVAKTALLQKAAQRFDEQAAADLKRHFERFVEEHDTNWLHDYALFRALKRQHNEQAWQAWPAEYARRDVSALQRFAQTHAASIRGIKFAQFLFDRQLQELRRYANENGVRLFGDMPIYIALDSADAWSNPELLRLSRDGHPDRVAGVPPDYFAKDGQLWGNPLYDWPAHAETGYRWWIERLRHAAHQADIVRIDHFRGFEAYWSVPGEAETARDGRWQPGPGDELFDALSDALGTLPIVAEDLGIITPDVEALRDRHDIPGMVVMQFEVREGDFTLAGVRENRVIYTGTHDNDTTVGWFRGSPDDLRSAEEIEDTQRRALALCNGHRDSIAMDLVNAAFATKARLAIAPLQDYLGLGSDARLNQPGSSGEHWRWRVLDSQLSDALFERVATAVQAAGRTPPELATRKAP